MTAKISPLPGYMHICNRTLFASEVWSLSSPKFRLSHDLPWSVECGERNIVRFLSPGLKRSHSFCLCFLGMPPWDHHVRNQWSLQWNERPWGGGQMKVPTVAPIASYVSEVILDHPAKCNHMSDPRWDQPKELSNSFIESWQIINHCCSRPLSSQVFSR